MQKIVRIASIPFYMGLALSLGFISPNIGQGDQRKMENSQTQIITTPSGLKYRDDKIGSGAKAEKGKSVSVHYTGWLDKNGTNGAKFDSSKDRGDAFEFPLGAGHVISGWDEGVAGMQVGGTRTLFIPPALGYGSRGAGGVIPPNADLIFEVELLEIK
jgi:FKBP-type peptidyl-prolyl cis-trans isomerase FkpA